MELCWVTLPVNNLEASLVFYQQVLGIPVDSRVSGDGFEMAMLGPKNAPKIELISLAHEKDKIHSSDISIGLAVDALDEAMALLQEKGIAIVSGPVSPAPYIAFLYIRDPDGYTIQLVETREPEA